MTEQGYVLGHQRRGRVGEVGRYGLGAISGYLAEGRRVQVARQRQLFAVAVNVLDQEVHVLSIAGGGERNGCRKVAGTGQHAHQSQEGAASQRRASHPVHAVVVDQQHRGTGAHRREQKRKAAVDPTRLDQRPGACRPGLELLAAPGFGRPGLPGVSFDPPTGKSLGSTSGDTQAGRIGPAHKVHGSGHFTSGQQVPLLAAVAPAQQDLEQGGAGVHAHGRLFCYPPHRPRYCRWSPTRAICYTHGLPNGHLSPRPGR